MSMVARGGGAPNDSLLTRFPVYQIDFSAVASGKRIATTKRRIRWRFGFTNPDALLDGQTGTACRGEEHDVTVVWSITSGKRQITMDGKEVHYSASRGGLLDFSWSVRGNHVLKVVAHASPPLSATPGFRQYDLFIDGQSFFSMPKVYELGIRGGPTSPPGGPRYAGAPDYAVGGGGGGYSNYDMPRGGSSYGVGGSSYGVASAAPRSASQEEEDLKRAIAESLEESRRHLSSSNRDIISNGSGGPEPPKENGTADLLDFANETPAPAALPAPPAPVQDAQTIVSYQGDNRQYPGAPPAASASYDAMSMTSAPAYGAPPATQYSQPQLTNGGPPLPPQQQFAPPPPPPAQTQFAPPAPAPVQDFTPQPTPYAPVEMFAPQADDPFAPKPPPPPTADDVNRAILGAYGTPGQPQQNGTANAYQTPLATGMPAEAPPQQQPGDAPQLSMNAAFEEPPEEPKSEVEEAMAKLVNIDRIDEPAEKEIKLTMQREEEKKKKNKTKAIPPAGTGYLGSNATLSQIKEVKPKMPHKDPSEIMSPPPMLFSPGAVNAGALVIHGEGPPPLQQGFGVGFGVGAQMQYQQQQYGGMPPQQQYYAQQQQQPPPPPQQQYYRNY